MKISVPFSFLITLFALSCNIIKRETLAQVFPFKFGKISKNPSGRLLLYVVPTHSNTAFSQEKTSQRLNIPYRVLYKDALTINHVRCVSSNQKPKNSSIKKTSFSLVDWLGICFLNYKIPLFQSIKLSCNNSLRLQLICCRAKFFIYLLEAFVFIL